MGEIKGAIGQVSVFALPSEVRPALGGIGTAPRRMDFMSLPFSATSVWITGITKDSSGAILGSCTVDLFRTTDDAIIATTTSDPTTGAYSFAPTMGGPFYVVAYKAGSPDVAGTTVNTLQPGPGAPPVATYASTLLGMAPKAWWRLGESSGTTAVDSSGNGFTGTYAGSPTLGVTGPLLGNPSTAATFNGTTGKVTAALSGVTDVLSLVAWVKRNTLGAAAHQTFMLGTGAQSFQVGFNASFFGNDIVDLQQSGVGMIGSGPALADTNWHQIVITKNGATLVIYYDGASQTIANAANKTLATATGVTLASDGGSSGEFDGLLADVAVFDRVLAPAEVSALYAFHA